MLKHLKLPVELLKNKKSNQPVPFKANRQLSTVHITSQGRREVSKLFTPHRSRRTILPPAPVAHGPL